MILENTFLLKPRSNLQPSQSFVQAAKWPFTEVLPAIARVSGLQN